jgi:hypothetical protein
MGIYQGLCSSFKQELLEAVHDFTTDTFKVALFSNSADLSANTTAYSATGEVDESGYTAGGAALTPTVTRTGGKVEVSFANVSWTSEIDAYGALIYNSSKSNKAVAVLSFGGERSSVSGVFLLKFPAAGSDFPVIRLQ